PAAELRSVLAAASLRPPDGANAEGSVEGAVLAACGRRREGGEPLAAQRRSPRLRRGEQQLPAGPDAWDASASRSPMPALVGVLALGVERQVTRALVVNRRCCTVVRAECHQGHKSVEGIFGRRSALDDVRRRGGLHLSRAAHWLPPGFAVITTPRATLPRRANGLTTTTGTQSMPSQRVSTQTAPSAARSPRRIASRPTHTEVAARPAASATGMSASGRTPGSS